MTLCRPPLSALSLPLPSHDSLSLLRAEPCSRLAAAYQMEFLSLFYGQCWLESCSVPRAQCQGCGRSSPSARGPGSPADCARGPGLQAGCPQLSSSSGVALTPHPEQTNFLNTEHLPSLGNTQSEDAVTPGIQNVFWQ